MIFIYIFQDIHKTNLLMQTFFPLLLSVKMLKCQLIRTEKWTVSLDKNSGKFITVLGISLLNISL